MLLQVKCHCALRSHESRQRSSRGDASSQIREERKTDSWTWMPTTMKVLNFVATSTSGNGIVSLSSRRVHRLSPHSQDNLMKRRNRQ